MHKFISEIHHALQGGESLVLASIVDNRGSTPRGSGTRMLVHKDGRIFGTIGGGGVEAEVIRAALALFADGEARLLSFSLDNAATANQLDMICGGDLRVLIERLAPDAGIMELFRRLAEEIAASRPLLWVGLLEGIEDRLRVERAARTADGEWIGAMALSRELAARLDCGDIAAALRSIGGRRYVIEAIDPPDSVVLIGAGHISREIARLTGPLGFRTLVIDDRAEFANTLRFPDADQVLTRPDFSSVFEGLPVNERTCLITLTRTHAFDREVLAQALGTTAGYIGMIGSRRKRGAIYRALEDEGFSPTDLQRVHCPIGLEIGADTPAEIAVSVAAQLIAHRAARGRRG